MLMGGREISLNSRKAHVKEFISRRPNLMKPSNIALKDAKRLRHRVITDINVLYDEARLKNKNQFDVLTKIDSLLKDEVLLDFQVILYEMKIRDYE